MNKKRILLIMLIIFVIVLCICVYTVNYISKNRVTEKGETDAKVLGEMKEIEDTTERNTVIWYADCYVGLCNNKSDEALMSVLDQDYILENDINEENVIDIVGEYPGGKINVEFLEAKRATVTINNYYLKGKVGNKQIKLLIRFDYSNQTFAITPCNDLSDTEFLQKFSNKTIENYYDNLFKFQK